MSLNLIIFEDDDLLAVNKPAGLNTHAPDPFAQAGLYEWLRAREPRWAELAVVHRLDKETSGVILFPKSPRAKRSLTQQFEGRGVEKTYVFLTDHPVPDGRMEQKSMLARQGDRYRGQGIREEGAPSEGRLAVTSFERSPGGLSEMNGAKVTTVIARPLTGRTHQIRVHAAELGFPVLGDELYGGTPSRRLYLHAARAKFVHPASGEAIILEAPPDLRGDASASFRQAIVDHAETDAFRCISGTADGWPGWTVDVLGEYLLSQSGGPLTGDQETALEALDSLASTYGAAGVYHKALERQIRAVAPGEASPRLVTGRPAPDEFRVMENGLGFLLSFREGYSTGLFLDQRDNRRRLLTNYVASGLVPFPDGASGAEMLNVFAYTCAFSVAAAKAGARVTSLDLSKKYLDWGRRNFELNGLDPKDHDFIYGDAFDWMRRLRKRGRQYDVLVLDPPTFSTSKRGGAFRAEKDYGELVAVALPLVKSGGMVLASTNAARLKPADFSSMVERAVGEAGRRVEQRFFASQAPDFRPSRAEPAYLKTLWLRIS